MKLACVLATTATASLFKESDRKFSDQPDWIAKEIWENWGNESPGYRIGQLYCRVDMFVDTVFADAPAQLKANIRRHWKAVAGTIRVHYEGCNDVSDLPYEGQGVNCGWREWLDDEDLTVDNKINTFVVWNGVAVREGIYKNGLCKNHERRAMRIVSIIKKRF